MEQDISKNPLTDVPTATGQGNEQSNGNNESLNVSLSGESKAAMAARIGLNDNKAGMEGLDKERINQIIMEASKGEAVKNICPFSSGPLHFCKLGILLTLDNCFMFMDFATRNVRKIMF